MLNDTFTIQIDGKPKDIFMSFGLLDELISHLPDPDAVGLVLVDRVYRNLFLKSLLSERTKTGRLTQEIDPLDTEISPEDALKLVEWATGKVLDFFVAGAQAALKMHSDQADKLKGLTSSAAGLKA